MAVTVGRPSATIKKRWLLRNESEMSDLWKQGNLRLRRRKLKLEDHPPPAQPETFWLKPCNRRKTRLKNVRLSRYIWKPCTTFMPN